MAGVRCARWSIVMIAVAGLAQPVIATGPKEQTVPWRAAVDHPLNSVVDIYVQGRASPNDEGTGSIIGKRIIDLGGGKKEGWLCVLTAAHVADEGGPFLISFGDGAQGGGVGSLKGQFGGANKSWSAVHTRTDLAIIAINYGTPDANFGKIFEHAMIPVTAAGMVADKTRFSELGYGHTGTFDIGGIKREASQEIKRFQNNAIAGKDEATVNGRTFEAVTWTFDPPKAKADDEFLASEGCSFPGDSGGPYFAKNDSLIETADNIPAIDRPGEWEGVEVPDWTAGKMKLYSQGIVAVHSYAEPAVAVGAIRGYGATGGAVPLTQSNIDWINGFCAAIPTPGSTACLAIGFLVALKRRRV